MPECWNPKLDPTYCQAVKLHRCREGLYLVFGNKASWADTGKQSKTKTVLHQKMKVIFKVGKKKQNGILSQNEKFQQYTWTVSATNVCKKHAVTAEIFAARQLRYFYTFVLKSQCLRGSRGLENIPFRYRLHLFHLLRSELHWLCSLPARSMFHLTFHLPNSPVHHIVVGYLLEQQKITKDSQQV